MDTGKVGLWQLYVAYHYRTPGRAIDPWLHTPQFLAKLLVHAGVLPDDELIIELLAQYKAEDFHTPDLPAILPSQLKYEPDPLHQMLYHKVKELQRAENGTHGSPSRGASPGKTSSSCLAWDLGTRISRTRISSRCTGTTPQAISGRSELDRTEHLVRNAHTAVRRPTQGDKPTVGTPQARHKGLALWPCPALQQGSSLR
mgnify:CR=1 FL=1